MTATAIASTIDALLSLARARNTELGSSIEVFDGLPPTDDAPLSYLLIGVSDRDDRGWTTAATSEHGWPVIGHIQRDEQFGVRCVAVGWNGDVTGMAAARADAIAAFDLLVAALMKDPTLGGAVLSVTRISDIELATGYSPDGPAANLRFTIECQARLA